MERPKIINRIVNGVTSIKESQARAGAEAAEELGALTLFGALVVSDPIFVVVGGIGVGLGAATDGVIEFKHWRLRRNLRRRLTQSPEEAMKKLKED